MSEEVNKNCKTSLKADPFPTATREKLTEPGINGKAKHQVIQIPMQLIYFNRLKKEKKKIQKKKKNLKSRCHTKRRMGAAIRTLGTFFS